MKRIVFLADAPDCSIDSTPKSGNPILSKAYHEDGVMHCEIARDVVRSDIYTLALHTTLSELWDEYLGGWVSFPGILGAISAISAIGTFLTFSGLGQTLYLVYNQCLG